MPFAQTSLVRYICIAEVFKLRLFPLHAMLLHTRRTEYLLLVFVCFIYTRKQSDEHCCSCFRLLENSVANSLLFVFVAFVCVTCAHINYKRYFTVSIFIYNWPLEFFCPNYELASHAAYTVCFNFIHEWIVSEWQIYGETFHGSFSLLWEFVLEICWEAVTKAVYF